MKAEEHAAAVDEYTKAIEIDATNAVYFCNRCAPPPAAPAIDAASNNVLFAKPLIFTIYCTCTCTCNMRIHV